MKKERGSLHRAPTRSLCQRPHAGSKRARSGQACAAGILSMLFVILSSACSHMTPAQKAQQQLEAARADVRKGKSADAIIEYRRALQADPRLAAAHFELGQLYVKSGDYTAGGRQLTAAVELDGSNSDARLALADLLLLARNFADAKTQADEVLTAHPGDPRAMLILAKCFSGLRQPKDAQSNVEQVLK
jgi:Tfp pilus assembly protein PilF